jgi:hypothetical protein
MYTIAEIETIFKNIQSGRDWDMALELMSWAFLSGYFSHWTIFDQEKFKEIANESLKNLKYE